MSREDFIKLVTKPSIGLHIRTAVVVAHLAFDILVDGKYKDAS